MPTPASPVPTRTFVQRSGPSAASSSFCAIGFSAGSGAVSLALTPSTYRMELHRGKDCDSPASLVAESTSGSLNLTVDAGGYHVILANPTPEAALFDIRVDYMAP